jgi:hypothetical protein
MEDKRHEINKKISLIKFINLYICDYVFEADTENEHNVFSKKYTLNLEKIRQYEEVLQKIKEDEKELKDHIQMKYLGE